MCVGTAAGAASGLAVYLVGSSAAGQAQCLPTGCTGPVAVGLDPVTGACFVAGGAFLALLVAAAPWVARHTEAPYRDELPPPGWRGGQPLL